MFRRFAFCIIFLPIVSLAQATTSSEVNGASGSQQQQQIEPNTIGGFLKDRITLGGFLDTAMSGIFGSDTSSQFSATPENFALNLAVDLNDRFRLNNQVLFDLVYPLENPDNNPTAPSVGLPTSRRFGALTTTTTVPQIYLEYGTSPEFFLQFGRGYAPYGIAFQIRDLALFRRRGGPQMINVNNDGVIVIASGTWTGVHVGGEFHLGDGRWGYDVYSLTPGSNPGALGVGTRAWWQPSTYTTLGVSNQIMKKNGDTYESVGADFQFKSGRIGADAEYGINLTGSGSGIAQTYYIEPYYTFFEETFLIYGVADYLENPYGNAFNGSPFLADPYEKWLFGGGVNWLPYTYTRFRLGLLYNDYTGSTATIAGVTRNYLSLDVSAGIEF